MNEACRETRWTKRKKRKKLYQTTLAEIVKTTQAADENIVQLISEAKGTQVSGLEQTKPDDVTRVCLRISTVWESLHKGRLERKDQKAKGAFWQM